MFDKQEFKCPLCGSSCFGTRIGNLKNPEDTSKWTIYCHQSDDLRFRNKTIEEKMINGVYYDRGCIYKNNYDNPIHWES